MERKADGGVVFRTTRAEEKEARRFDEMKHKAMEVLFAKVQAEFENEERGKHLYLNVLKTHSDKDCATRVLVAFFS